MKFWVCVTCGHLTGQSNGFCNYCSAPLPSFLHSPEQSQVSDGTLLGHLENGVAFHLPTTFAGYAFYGMTGVGKTTLASKLAIEAENYGIKLLILDPEGEWKNIIPHLKGKTEYYSTLHNLKINPFDLQDKGLIRLLLKETVFRGVETEYWDLSPQMNYVLDACIDRSNSIPELIQNVSYFQESDLPFKLVNIERTKTALLVRLSPYKNNDVVKEIFYCDKSTLDLNKLDDRNLIFDLHELESKVAYGTELRLVYNVLSIAALRQALTRNIADKIKNMLIADEAQLLVPKILRKLLVIDTWATTEFATRLRKRGQSVVIISQSPSNIEDDIRKNMQANFIFRLQSSDDIKLVAGMLGYSHQLKVDHLAQRLANLNPKQTIVKVSTVNEPFIINAVDVAIDRIGKKELENYMPEQKFNYSDAENDFLESIKQHPFISMVERRSLLGWDERRYSQVVGRLANKGVIEKVRVKLGKGAPKVLYQLKSQVPGIRHEYYVHWLITKIANMGLVCRAERTGPDIQIPSLNLAINVECGKSNIHGNIPKALKKFDMVIICSDSKTVIENVSRQNKDSRILCALIQEVPALVEKMRLDAASSNI